MSGTSCSLAPNGAVRGRFAPSPTGEVHLGNASSALLAWLSVRAQRGTMVMRMEDLDRARVRDGYAEQILRDLAWLGLDWDEGPDVGGPHEPYVQSRRLELYDDAFHRLREQDRVYACFCSRRDIASAASAPQSPGDEIRYPGTCRGLHAEEVGVRIAAGRRHSWRFRVEDGERTTFDDLLRGRRSETAAGDFVVRRYDDTPAYQLAVVVDDATMAIGEVVRGDDLLASTPRQLLLYRALGRTPPRFGHVPLLLDADGVRLSKRQRGVTLRELREAGFSAERVVGRLAHLLDLRPEPSPLRARDLIEDFVLRSLTTTPRGITVDVNTWSEHG